MAGHNIHIELNDDQEKFLKWLAKRDRVSIKDELQMMFYTEFSECEDLFNEEMKGVQE